MCEGRPFEALEIICVGIIRVHVDSFFFPFTNGGQEQLKLMKKVPLKKTRTKRQELLIKKVQFIGSVLKELKAQGEGKIEAGRQTGRTYRRPLVQVSLSTRTKIEGQ